MLAVLFAASLAVTPPKIAMPPTGCDPKHFLTKAFQDLLGRPIDASAEAYWLSQMKGGVTRTQVATQLMHSPEYANRRVQALFNAYLHRPADGAALNYYAAMLQHGGTDEQTSAAILGSSEYFTQRGGGTNPGFVNALYQDVLGRPADTQGVALFANQLSSGNTRAAIATQVLSSAEARQRAIAALYSKYLHHSAARMPAIGGIDQMAAAIIGSDEYCRE